MSDDVIPPRGFYFKVSFEPAMGDADAAFQEVGGIGPEMEIEAYREGGETRFVHSLPKGVKHPKLTLKRGVAPFDSELVTWCRDVLEGDLGQRIATKTVNVDLLAEPTRSLRSWSFQNAY